MNSYATLVFLDEIEAGTDKMERNGIDLLVKRPSLFQQVLNLSFKK